MFVACPKYRGESYDETHSTSEYEDSILGYVGLRAGETGVVAVQPITRRIAFANSCRCWICPYQSFAKSIHKGEDIEDGVVDLGDTEVDLGMSYVGVSRFKALSSFKMV